MLLWPIENRLQNPPTTQRGENHSSHQQLTTVRRRRPSDGCMSDPLGLLPFLLGTPVP